ncbi:MAG: hypothetical protein JXA18_00960, partial [Chitinispirillaceae bacterium]|nr:hypothetical protein [Chitinispirillaceae bacterium]
YADKLWINGENPLFSILFNELFSWGETRITMTIQRGMLDEITFEPTLPGNTGDAFKRALEGVPFDYPFLGDRTRNLSVQSPESRELLAWFMRIRF